MIKYIDADKLIAEIKRYKNKADNRLKIQGRTFAEEQKDIALQNLCGNLLHFIASLQQEQPVLPGIEDPGIPGKDFIPVEWVDACEMYGKWKIVKREQPEMDLLKALDDYYNKVEFGPEDAIEYETHKEIAHHFYELGKNARKEE